MPVWTIVTSLSSETDFEDYRDSGMCCSVIYDAKSFPTCRVCYGEHSSTERRLRCDSETCGGRKACLVRWKVRTCSASGVWQVMLNDRPHGRGALPCRAVLMPKLTLAMKAEIVVGEERGDPPRAMLANLKKKPALKPRIRGWPTHDKLRTISSCCAATTEEKTPSRPSESMSAKPPTQSIMKKKLLLSFLERALIWRALLYVGSGDDNDPFVMGVTTKRLLMKCALYSSSEHRGMFHADATFNLSDIGYPVITCGFTDKPDRTKSLLSLL